MGRHAEGVGFFVMKFTTIHNRVPKVIGKYRLADGTAGTEMRYKSGTYEVTDCKDLDAFANHLDALKAGSDYLCFGTPKNGEVKGRIAGGFESPGVIRKTKANFVFHEGPGVMLIDCDGKPLGPNAMHSVLRDAAPALAGAALVWLPSASSYLYQEEDQFTGLRGSHGYIGVLDASDIPRAGQVLFDRLWLAGHGSIKLDTQGAQLLRAPYDRALLTPIQPDFAAGCYCEAPFSQRRGESEIIDGVDVIDTREALPDLTADERARLAKMQSDAMASGRHEALAKRDEFMQLHEKRIMALDSPLEWRSRQVRAMKSKTKGTREALPLEWEILMDDFTTVTVREILLNPMTYDNRSCHDPLNHSYLSGYIHTDGRPCIYACSSGGVLHELATACERAELRNERWEAAAKVFG